MQPYQYHLSGVTFGRDTQIPISKVDIQTYNVNNQDFQVSRSDENRFGIDTLAPAPIIFTMSVMNNFELESMSGLSSAPQPDDLFAGNNYLLNELASVWKNPPLRMTWGATVPLLFCDKNGQVRRIYGRPGKFAHAPRSKAGECYIDVQAEFRRADTYAHSDLEFLIGDSVDFSRGMAPGADPVVATRLDGDGTAWLRILIIGPATHPLITYGDKTIELDLTIAEGVALEVSSYPWQRRVVDSNNVNHRSDLIGDTLYLDQIQFLEFSSLPVSWVCDGSGVSTQLFFLWREAYNVV